MRSCFKLFKQNYHLRSFDKDNLFINGKHKVLYKKLFYNRKILNLFNLPCNNITLEAHVKNQQCRIYITSPRKSHVNMQGNKLNNLEIENRKINIQCMQLIRTRNT